MNVSISKLPATNCKIPVAGTKEFKEWKAEKQIARENADTFNGKSVEEKQPSLLNKVADFFKNKNKFSIFALPETNCKIPMAGTEEFKEWKAQKQQTEE